MIRRLLVASLCVASVSLPALAVPTDVGPDDGWAKERAQWEAKRRDPMLAGLLNGLLPGMGSAYQGDVPKAMAQAGTALGVLVGGQLISTGLMALTGSREVALFFTYAPYPAYVGYLVGEGYWSTQMTNQQVEHRLDVLTPVSFRWQVARF